LYRQATVLLDDQSQRLLACLDVLRNQFEELFYGCSTAIWLERVAQAVLMVEVRHVQKVADVATI
jgi:hypothetical protein